ncbi:hypothetical protein [Nocardia terpenica]|uniref:hypothetical protein n=1 Tax=Nocardia terpenica TaxID=455432 RepID=UPI003182F5B1
MTALKATTASKSPRRGATRSAIAVAALAAGAALALSGCSAGQISQTADQVAAVNGNTANVGQVALRNVRILLPQSEEYTNAKGGKAVLAFSAINNSGSKADELTSITSDLGTVKITPANPPMAPLQTVVAASPQVGVAAAAPSTSSAAPTTASASSATPQAEAAGGAEHPANPESKPLLVEITGLTKDVTPGLTYPVTFNFKENGTVLVNVPVDAGPDLARHEPAAAAENKGGH